MKVLLDRFKTKLKMIEVIPGHYDEVTGDYVDEEVIEKEVEGTFMPIGRNKLQADTQGFYTVSDMIFYSDEIFKKGTILTDLNNKEEYKVIESKDYGYINPHYKVTVVRRVEK